MDHNILMYYFAIRCNIYLLCIYRGMTWLSTLVSNCLVLHSLTTDGCNLMDHVVWSHPLSMVMSAAPTPWLSSGPRWHRAWPLAQWRECWLALSQSSTGHLSEMTSPGFLFLTFYLYSSNYCFALLLLHLELSNYLCFFGVQVWDMLPNSSCNQKGGWGSWGCWYSGLYLILI